jgi:transposase
VLQALPLGISLEQVDIWFQDEARVGQRGTVSRIWALKGTRPRICRQQQFEYLYIFGAVCPERDLAVAVILPTVNSDAMQVHLEHISAQIPQGRHGVVVCDRAAWHTCKKVRNFNNLTIVFLPAYSPELNPTELVWKQLRDRWLSNRSYVDYQDLLESTSSAWNQFTEQSENIRKLCSKQWAIFH